MLYDRYFIDDLKDRADLVRRFLLLATSVVVLGLTVAGQEPPKAVLVDEFAVLPCEHLLALTDALAAELDNDPQAIAVIELNNLKGRVEYAESRRKWISSTLQLRGKDIDRFKFYLGNRDGAETRYWIVPAGAEHPLPGAAEWSEPAPETKKSYIFGYADENGICPTFVPKNYAKLILDNPGSRGHIVVRRGNYLGADRYWFAKESIDLLVKTYKVPRQRLRLFFAKGSGVTEAEFWFVPAKKK